MPGGMLATIGRTPVVHLEQLVEPGMGEVWVKLESVNPTGSYKDRMALAMIEGAERAGRLAPGQTVVEYTGGSTGSSLAYVCALKGYPLRIVSSDAFAAEKLRTMAVFGADVEIVPSPQGITPELIPRMMERAREIVDETGGYATDQFRNEDMVEGYGAMADELAEQLEGRIDAFCAYVGTAGLLHRSRAPSQPARARRASSRRRASRVARALRGDGRHAPDRGRRIGLLAPATARGRLRRGPSGGDSGCLRHGAARGA